jgi:hypothetical protein
VFVFLIYLTNLPHIITSSFLSIFGHSENIPDSTSHIFELHFDDFYLMCQYYRSMVITLSQGKMCFNSYIWNQQ